MKPNIQTLYYEPNQTVSS